MGRLFVQTCRRKLLDSYLGFALEIFFSKFSAKKESLQVSKLLPHFFKSDLACPSRLFYLQNRILVSLGLRQNGENITAKKRE